MTAKKHFFFSTLILLFFLTATELYLRCSMPHMDIWQLIQPSEVPGLINELRPGIKISFNGLYKKIPSTAITVSPQGLRDKEYSLRKPPGVKRLAVLGDSIAFGWGVENNQCFPKVLEEMLNASGGRYEVLNFSVPGYNLKQELICLKEKTLQFDIDYALVYLVNNDFEPPVGNKKNAFWNMFEKSYLVRRLYLCARILTNNSRLMNREYYSNGTDEIAPLVRSIMPALKDKGAELIFAFQNIARSDILNLERLRGCSRNNGIAFLPIDEHLKWSQELQIKGDGHPNAKGHQVIAETIFSFLKRQKWFQL